MVRRKLGQRAMDSSKSLLQDARIKMNVNKTFIKRPLNALRLSNLRPLSK